MTTIQNPTDEEIQQLLRNSKRIAVVGLSNNPDRTSYQVSKIMQQVGYKIIPVNPMIDEALGEKAVPSLREIARPVDIVNVFRRSEFLPEIATEAIAIGAKAFWAQLGVKNEEAYNILKENGMMTIMDICIKVAYGQMR